MSPNGIRVASIPDQGALPSLTTVPVPKRVVLPLQSPWGNAAPLVKVGDAVKVGQCIAGGADDRVPPVYASVSGIVEEVGPALVHSGLYVKSITIKSDGREDLPSGESAQGLSESETLRWILAAGVTESDGYPLPLPYRLAAPELAAEVLSDPPASVGKPIETLIINGMDRQPGDYLRCAELTRNGPDLVEAVSILKKISNAGRIVLAVTQSVTLEAEVRDGLQGLGVEVQSIPDRYPMALEPLLVQAVTGKEIPYPAADSREIGVAVVSAVAAMNLVPIMRDGRPPVTTVVQITSPGKGFVQHLEVRIGTALEDLLEHLPRLPEKLSKVIVGGLFLGNALHDLGVPITPATDSIVFQGESEVSRYQNHPCVNCGFCVRHCPMRLMPNELSKYCEYGSYEEAEKSFLSHCIECGICAYVCPARRPMVQLLRFGKQELVLMATED